MKVLVGFTLALALAGLTACGSVEVTTGGAGGQGGGTGGSGGQGGSTVDPAAESACEAHSAAVCGKELLCFPGREKVIGPIETCTERMKVRCLSRLGLPETGVTPAALTACAEAMSAPGCDMYLTFPGVCLFKGAREIGATCTDSGQCASAWCEKPGGSSCGSCAAPKSVEMCLGGCGTTGSSCSFEGTSCSYSKICNGGMCYPGPEEGETCGSFPYYCTYPAACINYECTLEVPEGC